MSVKNQSDLFVLLDPAIEKLCKEHLYHVDFDNRTLINCIVFNEICNLIISRPDLSEGIMTVCTEALMRFLKDGGILQTLKSLTENESLTYIVEEKGTSNKVTFNIKNVDYYLLESYHETALMRDARVETFLSNFIVNFSLEQEITDGSFKQAEDVFYAILKKTTDRYYFLTDADLNLLITWLVNSYNEKSQLFSTTYIDHGKKFLVPLVTRNVFIYWMDISGKWSKKSSSI